jgi:hypothetical protein
MLCARRFSCFLTGNHQRCGLDSCQRAVTATNYADDVAQSIGIRKWVLQTDLCQTTLLRQVAGDSKQYVNDLFMQQH